MNASFQEPEIRKISAFKLVGLSKRMSLANNLTSTLWSAFMPRRKEIGSASTDLYSAQVYDSPEYFRAFNPEREFEKWAAVRVDTDLSIPAGMSVLGIPDGEYAVFHYRGRPADSGPFFNWIFSSWLPASKYIIDDRPHFDLLGEKYRNNDPLSEEEIWIPVKSKS